MDKAGRIIIPAQIREKLGMLPGPVDLFIDGTGVRIEVEAHDRLVEKDGLLVIPASGVALTDDLVRELRLADQRWPAVRHQREGRCAFALTGIGPSRERGTFAPDDSRYARTGPRPARR